MFRKERRSKASLIKRIWRLRRMVKELRRQNELLQAKLDADDSMPVYDPPIMRIVRTDD